MKNMTQYYVVATVSDLRVEYVAGPFCYVDAIDALDELQDKHSRRLEIITKTILVDS